MKNIEKYLKLENAKEEAIKDYVLLQKNVDNNWTPEMWRGFVDWLFTERRHRWLVTFKTYMNRYEQAFRVDAFSEKDAVAQLKSMVNGVQVVFDVLDLGLTTGE